MNLKELVDIELQQDKWSLARPKFGKEGQLEVVGWSGKSFTNKYYILKCDVCSSDEELFGEGYFRSAKSELIKGTIPCGCSKRVSWSVDQYVTLCKRKATELMYTFLGFHGQWKGSFTKVEMCCRKHGDWKGGTISDLLCKNAGCPSCKLEKIAGYQSKTEEEMVSSFFASGAFHPNTKFWKSERTTVQGVKSFWYSECGFVVK